MSKPAAGSSVPARLGLLASLYFCQGLPFGFFTQSLPVVLRENGFSLGAIGLSSLLALPWALKFLWAPALDRHGNGRLGRRRSWILPLQLGTVAVLVVLAATPVSMNGLMAAVLLLNLLAATQDIATDGLAVDLLGARERGLGNGLQVAGYRVGMIVGGGALLILQGHLGPSLTFLVMAALTAVATAPILFAREPRRPSEVTGPDTAAHFLRRPGAARLLVLIVVYKAGDAFALGMLRPFLADAGLGLAQIGWLIGTVGFVAGLLGALVGGALVNRIGRRSALTAFGLLQAAAVAGYACLAVARPGLGALYLLCALEHLASGMATAALFTCMMDWCAPRTGATDYTVQASAVVVATGAAQALSGFSAQVFGYPAHFSLATVLAVAGVVAAWRLFPATQPSRTAGATAVVSCA
jgi:MFS transporter, PAT family, beta-lactamase induction signal transducer AmpG